MLDRNLGKANVASPGYNGVEHEMRGNAEDGEIQPRAVGDESADEARQIAVGECRQGGNAQGAAAALTQIARSLLDAGEADEGALDFAVERQGFPGRNDAGAAPDEEPEPERLLQIAEEPAHRRLRDVHQLGRWR